MIKISTILFIFLINLYSMGMPNTYYKIKNIHASKKYFFTFISKLAKAQNKYILEDRNFIKNFYPKHNNISKTSKEYKKFLKITKRYKLNIDDKFSKYLYHIDIIPVSLVLAQAATESGWGKSRFVKEANNIFGQWTWSGKGLHPKDKDKDLKHKIKIFNSLDASVRGYMINLNLGWAYKDFRNKRAKMRKENKKLSGLILSKTLLNYSQKKEEYIKLLDTMITINELERFEE